MGGPDEAYCARGSPVNPGTFRKSPCEAYPVVTRALKRCYVSVTKVLQAS
jgi:hypothetical protein